MTPCIPLSVSPIIGTAVPCVFSSLMDPGSVFDFSICSAVYLLKSKWRLSTSYMQNQKTCSFSKLFWLLGALHFHISCRIWCQFFFKNPARIFIGTVLIYRSVLRELLPLVHWDFQTMNMECLSTYLDLPLFSASKFCNFLAVFFVECFLSAIFFFMQLQMEL